MNGKNVNRFEGAPCKSCGQTLRYIKNKRCVACKKLLDKASFEILKNKENALRRQQTTAYKAYQKDYQKEYSKSHPRTEYMREYQNSAEYKKYKQMWWKTEKGQALRVATNQKRRALYHMIEGEFTAQEWLDLKEKYKNRCLCCGRHQSELIKPLETDHVVPVAKGGMNWIWNIQPLCKTCNGPSGKWKETKDFRQNPHPLCLS